VTNPKAPTELTAELREIQDEFSRRYGSLIMRWPNFRQHIACSELGAAIALADTFGVDVEAFLVNLRQHCGRAVELLPPEGS
jgi:hypothetical protein